MFEIQEAPAFSNFVYVYQSPSLQIHHLDFFAYKESVLAQKMFFFLFCNVRDDLLYRNAISAMHHKH